MHCPVRFVAHTLAFVGISVLAASAAAAEAALAADSLARGKPATAKSEESGKNNFARNAVDGKLNTRWCASGPKLEQWWQVDLGKKQHVRGCRIYWEFPNQVYRYRVEASPDGENWKNVVDRSQNNKRLHISSDKMDAPDTRFLRVTVLDASGKWASFWEFEAFSQEPPPVPKLPAKPAAHSVADVQAPAAFEVSLFGTPPQVNYPVCLAAAPTGEVFVGVDEQGSLGKEPGRGKILRLIDSNNDGQADQINEFAKVDHPRGLVYDQGTLWVLHPPYLSVHFDDDLDGVSDRHKTLITGISTDYVNKRGADHTTNGIRMGIDGWIYIAVGDFGFTAAKGTDGTTLSRRGGGIVRVRPDGTEMEIYAWGLRNILDVCIDPYMNVFTRDNTNDGGGWDVRLSHILQSAHYGYPSWYLNFTDEIMPPLADYGGGSGCGGMYLHDLRWPEPYRDALYTCDWGRSEVYRHNLPAKGATFDAHQDVFVRIPRPTDIDVDGSGRMYLSSWKGGKFNFSGPNVGFVARLVPKEFELQPFPALQQASDAKLVEYLAYPSAVYRFHSSRELLRRGRDTQRATALAKLAANDKAPRYARVAAIFTLKQLDGAESHPRLLNLAGDADVREFALRALTDRKSQCKDVPLEPFVQGLNDANPRVQARAVISLGRLGRSEAAEHLLPLAASPPASAKAEQKQSNKPRHAQPDPARVLPHLAVRALDKLHAVDACLAALDGPHRRGALWALRYLHDTRTVEGLIKQVDSEQNPHRKSELLSLLVRLYHREGEFKQGWWGTRPDTTGPYYSRQTWEGSAAIAAVLNRQIETLDERELIALAEELRRHRVKLPGVPKRLEQVAKLTYDGPAKTIQVNVPKFDPNNPQQIGNQEYDSVLAEMLVAKGNAKRGEKLFKRQSCLACHTTRSGEQPVGPHLGDIGKRYNRKQLTESILKPSAQLAQGFKTNIFLMADGKTYTGFVVREAAEEVEIRTAEGKSLVLIKGDIEERGEGKISVMPNGLANNLTRAELADLIAYLESLTTPPAKK